MWEALDKAAYYQLANLVAIVDVNRLGQRGPTELDWDLDAYARRAEAFGARVIMIDGHDLDEIDEALAAATGRTGDQPTVILARTIKGRGFSEVEDHEGWHGKPLPQDMAERAIAELGGETRPGRARPAPGRRGAGRADRPARHVDPAAARTRWATRSRPARPTATRWPRSAAHPRSSRSTARSATRPTPRSSPRPIPSATSRCSSPNSSWSRRPSGSACVHYVPFASTFAAFFTRAYDFIRMAADLAGRHPAGRLARRGGDRRRRAVPDGARGPGDDAGRAGLDGALPERRHQHRRAGGGHGRPDGVSYMRTTRGAYPVLYEADETFPVGGCKVLRSGAERRGHPHRRRRHPAPVPGRRGRAGGRRHRGPGDRPLLGQAGRHRDAAAPPRPPPAAGSWSSRTTTRRAASARRSPTPCSPPARRRLRIAHLAVRELPGSGTTEELLAAAGIDADHIDAAARELAS